MNEFEEFTKKTFFFAVGAIDFAVEKTGKAVQDLTEQTQSFVEEMSERGQEVSERGQKTPEPNGQFRKWDTKKQDRLWEQLLVLVNRDEELANRLISSVKTQYPGHSEGWYIEKAIHDLERDRGK